MGSVEETEALKFRENNVHYLVGYVNLRESVANSKYSVVKDSLNLQ